VNGLLHCCRAGSVSLIKWFVSKGCDLNRQYTKVCELLFD